MNKEYEIRANAAPWNNGVDFLCRDFDGNIVKSLRFSKPESRYSTCKPTFSLSVTQAQTLMDDLWNAGLRPTEGSGSAGSLRATESHLNDMRKIAFKKLGVEV
jgi:hypothetical protein